MRTTNQDDEYLSIFVTKNRMQITTYYFKGIHLTNVLLGKESDGNIKNERLEKDLTETRNRFWMESDYLIFQQYTDVLILLTSTLVPVIFFFNCATLSLFEN